MSSKVILAAAIATGALVITAVYSANLESQRAQDRLTAQVAALQSTNRDLAAAGARKDAQIASQAQTIRTQQGQLAAAVSASSGASNSAYSLRSDFRLVRANATQGQFDLMGFVAALKGQSGFASCSDLKGHASTGAVNLCDAVQNDLNEVAAIAATDGG